MITLMGAGCRPAQPEPVILETSMPPLSVTARSVLTQQPSAAPLPTLTPTPSDALTITACQHNTRRVVLTLPTGQPPFAVSRVAISAGWLYVLADGGLYRAALSATGGPGLMVSPLLLPGQLVGERPIQELTDLDTDPATGQVAVLDKAGHVFGYDPSTGLPSLIYRATRDQEQRQITPFQLNAIAFDQTSRTSSHAEYNGRILALDSSSTRIWAITGQTQLETVAAGGDDNLATGIDIASLYDNLVVMQSSGTVIVPSTEPGWIDWTHASGSLLGLSVSTATDSGAPVTLVVDGLRRSVSLFPFSFDPARRVVFDLPDLDLLRDATLQDGTLYALDGSELLVTTLPAGALDQPDCPAPPDAAPAVPSLYGFDVRRALQGAQWPLANVTLPAAPHAYPGASRIYRLGVHNGTDLYGFAIGTPVTAAAPGVVLDATLDYPGLSYSMFQDITYQSEKLGMTPPDILERLEGKKVVIYHGNSISTVYAHLDTIADGIAPGVEVQAGQLIGTVGVTGTSAESRPGTEDPHLHFEIWLGDHYLGQGITIRETMWWFEQVFAPPHG